MARRHFCIWSIEILQEVAAASDRLKNTKQFMATSNKVKNLKVKVVCAFKPRPEGAALYRQQTVKGILRLY